MEAIVWRTSKGVSIARIVNGSKDYGNIAKDLGVENYHIIDTRDIPSDRTYRDAWELDITGLVIVNLDKAKVIHEALMLARALEQKHQDDKQALIESIPKIDLSNVNSLEELSILGKP